MKQIKFIIFILFISIAQSLNAQELILDSKEEPSFAYEDVSMILVVDGVGSFNLSTLYSEDDRVYLSIDDIFKVNEIDINSSRKGDTLLGFIKSEDNRYSLNYTTGELKIGNKSINVSKDLTKLLGLVYLDYSKFGELFGLKIIYNSKKLSLDLKADFETPVLKRIKLDKSRKGNVKSNNDEIVPDTILNREYHLFKPGNIDWKVSSSQILNDTLTGAAQIGFSSEFLYGATNITIPVSLPKIIDGRKVNYIWRWIDNQKSIIKQANVGKVYIPTVSNLGSETVGFSIKNAPTTVIKASGYYTISDYTQPNWTVELYINNTLESFTKADASGLFVFKIPIVYGYTTLMLKFFGNRGEERTEERFLVAPNNIMPAKHFQYNFSGGLVNDTLYNGVATLNSIYGLNRFITLGGGIEYLSMNKNEQKCLLYSQVTFQPFNKLMIFSEYVHKVKMRYSVDFYLKLNSVLTFDYTIFNKNQNSILTQNKEVRKVILNTPFNFGKNRFIYKFEGIENVLSESKIEQINNVFSYSRNRVNINTTTSIYSTNYKISSLLTSLYSSYYTQKKLVFSSTTDYDLLLKKIKNVKFEVEKIFKLGTVSFSYTNKLIQKNQELIFKMRLDLNAVKLNFESKYSNKKLQLTEDFIGSIALGGNKMVTANNSMNGKGGMVLTYFLDINNNNRYDKGEAKADIKKVKVNSSKFCRNEKDTTLIVYDLNAFQDVIIENEIKELPSISWRFKKQTYKIMIDPDQLKKIEIPIEVMGEVNGFVYKRIDSTTSKGMGKVIVKFHHLTRPEIVYSVQTESDGFFTFIGLIPGEYAAIADPVQMEKINMISSPDIIKFTVIPSNEGSIIDGLEFYLTNKK